MANAVLVVEDDAILRAFLVDELLADGLRPDAAADGREALARLAGGNYDVVVTDLRMPGMSAGT